MGSHVPDTLHETVKHLTAGAVVKRMLAQIYTRLGYVVWSFQSDAAEPVPDAVTLGGHLHCRGIDPFSG